MSDRINSGRHFSRAAVLLVVGAALAGCQERQAPAGGDSLAGILAASAASFTMSPNRCVASFLYDRFRVEWLAGEPARTPEKKVTGHIRVAVFPAVRGKTLRLDLRGFVAAGGGAKPTLAVRVAGKTAQVPLPASETDFFHGIELPLAADADETDITIDAVAPRSADGASQVLLVLDSVDMALSGAGGCKSLEEEKAAMPPLPGPQRQPAAAPPAKGAAPKA